MNNELDLEEVIWILAWIATAAGGETNPDRCKLFANRCISDFEEKRLLKGDE